MASKFRDLSRRERQIMDIIYSRGEATAAEVHTGLRDRPSYSAVRALLRILEEKGVLKHREEGPRYVFLPVVPLTEASRSALKRVMKTFFAGSLANAVAAFVDETEGRLSGGELERIEAIIKKAKRKLVP